MVDAVKTSLSNSVTTGMSDVQRGLAWFISISFIALIFLWVLRPPVMAPESMAQLNQLVATLQNILLLAIGFFFGSSKSSQNKDDTIMAAALAETPVAVPPPGTTTTTTTTAPPADSKTTLTTSTTADKPPG